jgi:hypothetical protein
MMSSELCIAAPKRLTRAAKAHSTLLPRLLEAADAIESGQAGRSSDLLRVIRRDTRPDGPPVERLARAFARGLDARLAGDAFGTGNLYLENPDPRDMLAAFHVLMRSTPLIRFGYAAANHALARELEGAGPVHIVDIGIGSGYQWFSFLDLLSSRGQTSAPVRLTGIDVPAPGADPSGRLQEVGRTLGRRAGELGIPFSFEAVVGQVEDMDLRGLRPRDGEALAVNASFALHHLPSEGCPVDPGRTRDAVLRRIGDLRPAILTLAEPDVEHNALPLLPRLAESFVHYLTVFDALEALLPSQSAERVTLETAFFGREIRNIVVGEGSDRVERHERHWSWRDRLCRQGFEAIDLGGFAPDLGRELQLRPPFALTEDQGMMVLSWRRLPIIAGSAWKPGGGVASRRSSGGSKAA